MVMCILLIAWWVVSVWWVLHNLKFSCCLSKTTKQLDRARLESRSSTCSWFSKSGFLFRLWFFNCLSGEETWSAVRPAQLGSSKIKCLVQSLRIRTGEESEASLGVSYSQSSFLWPLHFSCFQKTHPLAGQTRAFLCVVRETQLSRLSFGAWNPF